MGLNARIQVLPDERALARAAADVFVRFVQEAVVTRGRAMVALAGGKTPGPTYRALARPPNSTRLDFSAIEFFFTDERCVGPEHAESNFGMARRALFAPAGVPPQRVHRIAGEVGPTAASAEYDRVLRGLFPGHWPVFDLVLLGLGADGHVASLFPGSQALSEATAWVAATRSPTGVSDRVSLTLPALNRARQVLFLVSGPGKADVVRRVLAGPGGMELPAGLVRPAEGQVLWLMDRAAGGLLPGGPANPVAD